MLGFGYWKLEFIWLLVFGIWRFLLSSSDRWEDAQNITLF
jgi:hypothetical protein